MTQKGIWWICLKGNITIKVRSSQVKNGSEKGNPGNDRGGTACRCVNDG